MRVRHATADDLPAVAGLEQAVFGLDAWSAASVAEELTGERRHAVVATDTHGEVVGYAVTMRAGDVVDLQRIAVHPAHRRTGCARRLLDEVCRTGRSSGAHRMLLEVAAGNEAALRLYADAGFVEIDRRPRYYRDGSDAVVLEGALDVTVCRRSRR